MDIKEGDYDEIQEMVDLLIEREYVLAVKTDKKLIFGTKATKKEKTVLT